MARQPLLRVPNEFSPLALVVSLVPFVMAAACLWFAKVALVLHSDASVTIRYLGRGRVIAPERVACVFVSRTNRLVVDDGRRRHVFTMHKTEAHSVAARWQELRACSTQTAL